MTDEEIRKRRTKAIAIAYPFGVLLFGVALNMFIFGINPPVVTLPTAEGITSLVAAAVLLVINHTWLMTTTELTRVKFNLYATPEEWAASGISREDASVEGLRELERRHNAHRNTTENVVYFIILALVFVIVSPPTIATQVWIIGFAVARLGYTYSYLAGRDNVRGLFMSLSLLAMYGMASYLAISLVVSRAVSPSVGRSYSLARVVGAEADADLAEAIPPAGRVVRPPRDHVDQHRVLDAAVDRGRSRRSQY